jgi:hypothetical protein
LSHTCSRRNSERIFIQRKQQKGPRYYPIQSSEDHSDCLNKESVVLEQEGSADQ